MNQETQNPGNNSALFERIKRQDPDGKEFWSSRELATTLEYSEYANFEPVITKAQQACFNSGVEVKDHFVQTHEMVEIGSNAKREIKNVMLSRYACYLITQNADPSKKIVAYAQTYFAIQTRRQELGDQELENQHRLRLRNEIKGHNRSLAGTAKEAGVIEPRDYAIFQNCGYLGLYNGLTKQDIHRRKGLKKGEEILDHMGSTELAANFFRVTQTEERIRKEKILGKDRANEVHRDVGQKVRKAIGDIGGTMPENLPSAENIKKIASKKRKFLEGPN